MTAPALIKQADVERLVRAAVRGAGLQPGSYEIRLSPTGSVRILPANSASAQDDDPDAELRDWLAENGDG